MKTLTQEKKFMQGLLGEFSQFVIHSMDEGHYDNFEDHHLFLTTCMELFIEQLENNQDNGE